MNQIHPTAIISGDVKLGENNQILPYTCLTGPLEIGDNNIIGPHVVIGSPGQDTRNPRYDSSDRPIKIGSRNIIREFTAIQKPCYEEITVVGDDVYLMQSVHIPHDALIEDKVVITPMVSLAGITRILEGANLAMGATVSQYCVVGQYAIVATGAAVLKNVKPFSRYIPGKPISINTYAIQKFGFAAEADEISAYVLEDKRPSSERLLRLVEHFEKYSIASDRGAY